MLSFLRKKIVDKGDNAKFKGGGALFGMQEASFLL
jgi:hypothetical protein